MRQKSNAAVLLINPDAAGTPACRRHLDDPAETTMTRAFPESDYKAESMSRAAIRISGQATACTAIPTCMLSIHAFFFILVQLVDNYCQCFTIKDQCKLISLHI
ncbi:conserved hypothetical protein [Trichinella spiralis]|uniref:hypothetical protein n=1 Tax=Trichinella spiralis TaxID=6334 RepID=UPI0001EFD980|nr:conserved hypothetical protein [Trichinella spiralis]